MPTTLKYAPIFRARQQELLVLNSTNFDEDIFPCIEIIKEYDRARKPENQKTFGNIYCDIIQNINAKKVFVDLPVYLKISGSTQDEVIAFNLKVLSSADQKIEYYKLLSDVNAKAIPVISSFILKTGDIDDNTIIQQARALRETFPVLAFRTYVPTFEHDMGKISEVITSNDYLIFDLDKTTPFSKSSVLREKVETLTHFDKCPIVVFRSAINAEIQNILLDHGGIVSDADNSLIEVFSDFNAVAFGDYCGIKKDDLTAGGTISPGFILYDAVKNQYYGFKSPYSSDNRTLADFEKVIVPDILNSEPVIRMQTSGKPYLTANNKGWETLQRISREEESGKSQAKFKKIAMEHYIHCIKVKIQFNEV